MNILFFLTPKVDVAYIYDTFSLRQVLEKMEYHKYSCIPVINEKGKHVGTITEGDLLWGLKKRGDLNLKGADYFFSEKGRLYAVAGGFGHGGFAG